MEEQQKRVRELFIKAVDGWSDGTEPALFPMGPEDGKSPGRMIWAVGLNALAYGLEHGMELGFKMKEGETA